MDTSVLGDLIALLGTPASIGVEQPSLEHFDINTALAAGRVAQAKPGPGAAASAAFLWGLSIVCLLALMSLAIARQHRRRFSRLRTVAATPLIVLAGVMTVVAAHGTWAPAAPVGTSTTLPLANAASRTSTATSPQTSGSVLLDRVLRLENQIAVGQVDLSSPSSSQGVAVAREEHRLAVALQADLQQEYDFFASVAKDPARSAALLKASATEPAKIRNAVTYDVQAVQAQLAQQAAITQAAQNASVVRPVAGTAGPAAPLPLHASPLMWPMSGVITQGFGVSPFAIEPTVTLAGISYPHFHTGVDIASTFGTPVQSAADGVVALAGAETDGFGHLVGYGNYVVIAHGGDMVTLYGHLEQVLVQPGAAVRAGDPIGREGSTGNSTGPHVHFELRIQGIPTNPANYVQPH